MVKRLRPNLKQLLDKKGITQKELAIATGIREATISDMCRDTSKRYPKDVLEKIINELGINDLNELLSIVEKEEQ